MVTRAFGVYSKGNIIPEMPGGAAREYIRRGFVQEVSVETPSVAARAVDTVKRVVAGNRRSTVR